MSSCHCRSAWSRYGVPAEKTGGDRRQGALPGFIEPALATSIEKVPSGDRWIHEIKFDGYRVQLHLANEAVKIYTRRGHDWTKRFKKVADDGWHISAGSAILDGEIVVPAADGTTDFSVLQNQLRGKSDKIVMVAFDLLYLNGYDLRKLPLFERKAHLKKLIDGTAIQFSESFEVDGAEMFAHACGTRARGRGLQGARQPLSFRPRQRLGQENLRPARDAADRRLRAEGQAVRRHLYRPAARATIWSMPARSTSASTRPPLQICRRG